MIITHGKSAEKLFEKYASNQRVVPEPNERKPRALTKAAQIAALRRRGESWRTIGFSLGICDKRAKAIYENTYGEESWLKN